MRNSKYDHKFFTSKKPPQTYLRRLFVFQDLQVIENVLFPLYRQDWRISRKQYKFMRHEHEPYDTQKSVLSLYHVSENASCKDRCKASASPILLYLIRCFTKYLPKFFTEIFAVFKSDHHRHFVDVIDT